MTNLNILKKEELKLEYVDHETIKILLEEELKGTELIKQINEFIEEDTETQNEWKNKVHFYKNRMDFVKPEKQRKLAEIDMRMYERNLEIIENEIKRMEHTKAYYYYCYYIK